MPSSKPASKPKFHRVILKISGEALRQPHKGDSIDNAKLTTICKEIKAAHRLGVQIGIVVGGGNIFRGLAGERLSGVDRTTGDHMGMLATIINGLALMDCLEKLGVATRVQSAITVAKFAEPFILRRAVRHMEKKRVVIFVAGTGNPYFSTDTTAALRANEIGAEILLKGTKVDGIYDKDPVKHKDAKRYTKLPFMEALRRRLCIMDSTAFSLCMDNRLPILVFDLNKPGNIRKALMGKRIGTLVQED